MSISELRFPQLPYPIKFSFIPNNFVPVNNIFILLGYSDLKFESFLAISTHIALIPVSHRPYSFPFKMTVISIHIMFLLKILSSHP